MNYLKKLGKSLIYVFSIMLVGIFIITLLNYIGFLNGKIFSFFQILILIISLQLCNKYQFLQVWKLLCSRLLRS